MTKETKNLIGVIGDMHMRDFLPYADYISDKRVSEKNKILDFIVKTFEDCENIVILGDIFHSKNNSSETNKDFVKFIENFKDKNIYMISGNHSKKGDGKTAIDFLKEIKDRNWNVYTNVATATIKNGTNPLKVSFVPYMFNHELDVTSSEEASDKLIKMMEGGDILFTHHAISGTTFHGIKTESLKEVVLQKIELEKRYSLIMAGHIHDPQEVDKIVVAGSVFTAEVGEKEKFVWKIKSDLSVEKIKLPGREIHKVENPTDTDLKKIKKSSIVKAIVTKKSINVDKLKEKLSVFDASLLIENYPNKRKKMHIEDGAFDFSIEALLKLYAKEKDVEVEKLLKGLALIN